MTLGNFKIQGGGVTKGNEVGEMKRSEMEANLDFLSVSFF